jgi:uncharacterized DUF497 family protein
MHGLEWDPVKAAANLRKHKVDLRMPQCRWKIRGLLTFPDPDATGDERFVTPATDPQGRVVVTVYSYSEANRRIISSRKASPGERKRYEIP